MGSLLSYAQSQPTKKELKQQQKERKQLSRELLFLDSTVRTGYELVTKKQLRQEQKLAKKQRQEQILFKADSIKIAATLLLRSGAYQKPGRLGSSTKEKLQVRNSYEAQQLDSLKKVIKSAKKIASAQLMQNEQVKQLTNDLDPYLQQYRQLKATYQQDSLNSLLQEGGKMAWEEAKKQESVTALTKEYTPYLQEAQVYKELFDVSKK